MHYRHYLQVNRVKAAEDTKSLVSVQDFVEVKPASSGFMQESCALHTVHYNLPAHHLPVQTHFWEFLLMKVV